MSPNRIVLCADDYGLSPGVSRGIRELLAMERLSATSCIVVFPEFTDDADLLRPFLDRADFGLHFTLTERHSLARVATQMHLRPPRLDAMIAVVEEQVSTFAEGLGKLPDYIDGHQHVHLLPVIREAVLHVAGRIGCYVRVTTEPVDSTMWRRPASIESVYLARASRRLSQLAKQAGVTTNSGFRGARNFRESVPYRQLFRSIIAGANDGCIIMCHPGYSDALLVGRDRVRSVREQELRYFMGVDFPADLAEAGLELSRLADAVRAA